MTRLFVSGTGTGVGKTWVARGIARALLQRGVVVVALKPVETGCAPEAVDASALARACRQPALANASGLYRARAALAPYAAALEGEPPAELAAIVAAVDALAPAGGVTLVEGAGGVLVPLDARHDMADLARALRARVLLVARDRLGVLSDVLSAYEAARVRELDLAAVVLSRVEEEPSQRTNARILRERLPCPVISFAATADDDDALAVAAEPTVRALGFA